MCDHLTAISEGVEIEGKPYNRLLMNVPPGAMKSLLVNVFFPAWEWGPRKLPHYRYICVSHSMDNAIRDSVKMRRLVSSEWYQSRWPIKLTGDQNAKTKFENTATGFRSAMAAGSITGARGDRVIIDDPLSWEGAMSEQIRTGTNEWFMNAVPTRLNRPRESAIVVIMQRLHEDDVAGAILNNWLGYDRLMLPMRYDPQRAFTTQLGTNDPRTVDGELLFPERFPEDVVDRLESTMSPYDVAGQHQQDPVPRGGGIIDQDWWTLWVGAEFPAFDYILASIDTAYTEKQENDYSACTIWGVFRDAPRGMVTRYVNRYGKPMEVERTNAEGIPNVMLIYAFQERLAFHNLVNIVSKKCLEYKVDTLLIEAKANGISLAQELRRTLSIDSFGIRLIDPKGDKVARLHSVQHLFATVGKDGKPISTGLIWAPDTTWAQMVIDQVKSFPKGKHDDLVDCTSQALRHLRDNGILQRAPERIAEIEEGMKYHPREIPLYPA
jgi:predicted phage terminase large subunit-like protein